MYIIILNDVILGTEFEPEMSSLVSTSTSNKRQLPSSQSNLNESSIRNTGGSSSTRAPINTAKKPRRTDPLASDDDENDPDYVFRSNINSTGVSSSQITIKKKTDAAQKKSTSGTSSRPPVSMDSTMVNHRSISHSDNFDASTPNISVTPLQFARTNEKSNNNQTFPHLYVRLFSNMIDSTICFFKNAYMILS